MALIDYYRKYMYGMPGQTSVDTGDVPATGMSTTGLFGVGGQAGGGLLNNFQRPDGGAVFDILSNPYVGIGGSLFTAGQRGQSIGQGGMQSVLQGLQFSETASKLEGARRKRQLIKEYADQVPEEDKKIFEINPEAYIEAKFKKVQGNLSQAGYQLYLQARIQPDFNKWFNSLSQADKDLYNKEVKPQQSFLDKIGTLTPPEEKKETSKTKKPDYNTWLEAAKKLEGNKGISDEQLKQFYIQKYGSL